MRKSEKRILSTLVIIGFIIITVLVLFFSRTLYIKNDIKKDLESTLYCFINDDFSNGFYYINMYGYKLSSINTTEFDKLVASQVKFKINDIETKNDEAIVRIEVQYPDLTKDLSKLQTENYYDTIYNADSIIKELDLYLLKNDNHWTLLQNKELLDVFSGGLSSVYSNSEEEAYKKLLDLLEENN